jgi:hypothetical protein
MRRAFEKNVKDLQQAAKTTTTDSRLDSITLEELQRIHAEVKRISEELLTTSDRDQLDREFSEELKRSSARRLFLG